MQASSKARAMLAGAPLMVAQLGALELRKKMLEGDTQILHRLNLTTPTTVLQVLKWLQKAPPLAILKLCNSETANFLMNNLLQHSDDLDFVQDVLNAVASHSEINPTMQAVLAGFNRRRNLGRFKDGQQ